MIPITSTTKYKPSLVWAWNDKLSIESTSERIAAMDKLGYGSVLISAQSGLETRFMGDEWFRNVNAAISGAEELGLDVWICDELCSPSGSGNGVVNSFGLEFQQKFLCCEPGEKSNDRTIVCKDGYHFYYDVNPHYADVLNKDTAQILIKQMYQPYIDKFSNRFKGYFSRNPQLSYDSIPWSFILPAEYKNAYGEELLDVLLELFRPVGNYKNTRIKFWKLITKLYSENFISKISQWCKSNNTQFAVLLSDKQKTDFTAYGSILSQFEYADIPCIDVISREDDCATLSIMTASVANQLEKSGASCMLFSCAGHNTELNELKKSAQLQLVRGIETIIPCTHSYSLKGIIKRTVSTTTYHCPQTEIQLTKFNEYISRISTLLSEGTADFNTLLLHNLTSKWVAYDNGANEGLDALHSSLNSSIEILEKKHIPFHIIDEILLDKYAYVDGDCICIGKNRYKNLVLPDNLLLLESTTKLLAQFEHGGGFITVADSMPSNEICDNENLIYTTRAYPDFRVHYFVNNSSEEFTSVIPAGSKMIDLSTGEVIPFYGMYKFSPYEGIVVINDNTPELPRPFKKPLKSLNLNGEWILEECNGNTLTLDCCDVYFDGELYSSNENAADVTEIAYSQHRSLKVECIYKFKVNQPVENIFLSVNSMQNFQVKINSDNISAEICDVFIDNTFPLVDISKFILLGENTVSISAEISPSDEFLNIHQQAAESKNALCKVCYDIEFEPIYIVGSFLINTCGEFRRLDRDAVRYIGDFEITPISDNKYNISNLEKQGFPFFAKELTFTKTVNLSDIQYAVKLISKGVSSLALHVNGEKAVPNLKTPWEFDLSSLLVKGDNTIKLTLYPTFRNLFGPHHLPIGEPYTVSAGDFYKRECIWNEFKATPWESNYCFTEFGIEVLE